MRFEKLYAKIWALMSKPGIESLYKSVYSRVSAASSGNEELNESKLLLERAKLLGLGGEKSLLRIKREGGDVVVKQYLDGEVYYFDIYASGGDIGHTFLRVNPNSIRVYFPTGYDEAIAIAKDCLPELPKSR